VPLLESVDVVLAPSRFVADSVRASASTANVWHYPQAVCAAATELLRVGPGGRGPAFHGAWTRARKDLLTWRTFRELWRARKM
jgi:hypothetical protein